MTTQKYGNLNDLTEPPPELEDAVKLDTLFGQVLEVTSFDTIVKVGANDCAIFRTNNGLKISSFSKVIIDQLKLMQPDLEKQIWFKVRPVKEKNYYKFEHVDA